MATDVNAQRETSALSKEIDTIVAQVKKAIIEVEKDAPSEGPQLQIKAAELTLNAVVTKDLGGDFSFKIFGHEFGGGVDLTKADTQTIKLKLTPDLSEAMEFGTEDVSARLVEAMRSIRDSVARAADEEPRFALEEASVELNFQVDKDGKISFIIAGEGKKTNAQTIALTLGAS